MKSPAWNQPAGADDTAAGPPKGLGRGRQPRLPGEEARPRLAGVAEGGDRTDSGQRDGGVGVHHGGDDDISAS